MSPFSPAVFALLAAAAPVPEGSVPVEEEPQHRTVFRNDYVRAFRVTLQPGQATLMHTHLHDDAAVRLSAATSVANGPGQAPGPPAHNALGSVSARDNEAKPTTHRVQNTGSTLFDLIDVQVMARPHGPATSALSEPVAENSKLRLYRYELAPGASTPAHAHARPGLLVAVTPAELAVSAPDGTAASEAIEAGDLRWIDGAGTHAFTNRGKHAGILVEFELK